MIFSVLKKRRKKISGVWDRDYHMLDIYSSSSCTQLINMFLSVLKGIGNWSLFDVTINMSLSVLNGIGNWSLFDVTW